MIYCTKCGASLPDDAKFCAKCGQPIGAAGGGAPAAAPAAASGGATIAAAGVQEMKCPSCGAPIKPVFGEMVITCDYCGGSVTLGGAGWKEIQKHTMLPLKVPDQAAAIATVRAAVDAGFFHRHDFEESKVTEAKLSYVPFWVMPVSASTTYQYQAAAASIGGTVGTIAAAELLGGVLGGGRGGGLTVVPIMAGPVVNPTRSETISGQFEFPVIAVKSMGAYQPKDYQFPLAERSLFDKKSVPTGTPVLNGDLGEDAAKGSAKAFVEQLQSEAAHKKHSMVSKLETKTDISEGELLHVPIWYFQLEHKGRKTITLIDGSAGRVIHTVE
jgi:zinc-ribbon domain